MYIARSIRLRPWSLWSFEKDFMICGINEISYKQRGNGTTSDNYVQAWGSNFLPNFSAAENRAFTLFSSYLVYESFYFPLNFELYLWIAVFCRVIKIVIFVYFATEINNSAFESYCSLIGSRSSKDRKRDERQKNHPSLLVRPKPKRSTACRWHAVALRVPSQEGEPQAKPDWQ